MNALQLNNVTKTRGKAKQGGTILCNVSLQVTAGEFLVIEGPSGVGKTTLLAVAAGLLQPDFGSVNLAGKTLQTMTHSEQRRHRAHTAGFVYQRSNLLDGLSARENILLMGALAGIRTDTVQHETARLLEQFGLVHLADRRPETLSGGEEQRFALARALVHRPAVVFADEPTGSLDSSAGRIVTESLRDAAREQGAAVIVVTHDSRLTTFATRRLHMMDGHLLEHT